MDYYEGVLEHVAEPADPANRSQSPHVTIEDWEALWLAHALRGYADYNATGEDKRIARGLAEYIDERIHVRADSQVTLYLHTQTARRVVKSAAEDGDTLSIQEMGTDSDRSLVDDVRAL